MALTGQAKTDYQRKYMQRYRAKNKVSVLSGLKQAEENASGLAVLDERKAVRPEPLDPVRPLEPVRPSVIPSKPEIQSYNPMMVGYVPPRR